MENSFPLTLLTFLTNILLRCDREFFLRRKALKNLLEPSCSTLTQTKT